MSKNSASSLKFKRLIFILCLLMTAALEQLFGQSFTQKLKWSADPNVFEYKIDIQDKAGKIIQTITTEDNFVELSLSHGKYKYRITAFDMLGRESVSTGWQDFEIISQKEEEERLAREKAERERKERLAAEKAERERLAKLEEERLARLEQERIERELAEKKRLEEQRLAIEQAEQEERARIAAEMEERKRIAAEIAAQEEAARLEEERIAQEKERLEREEEERLAREEAEREEEERLAQEKKEARRKAWENYDRKFGLSAGVGLALILYDSNFFNEFMKKPSLTPDLNARFDYLPFHNKKLRFGMEFNAMAAHFSISNDFYNLDLNMLALQENLALRINLNSQKTWLQIKGGAGLTFLQENLDYSVVTTDNKQNVTKNFGYFTAGGGLSIIFVPARLVTVELGADYYHLFIPDMNMGLLSPYVSLGLRF